MDKISYLYARNRFIRQWVQGSDNEPFPVMTVHEQARARGCMVMTWPHPSTQIDRCLAMRMGRGVGIWVHHYRPRPKEFSVFLPTLNIYLCMMSTSTTWRCTRCLR